MPAENEIHENPSDHKHAASTPITTTTPATTVKEYLRLSRAAAAPTTSIAPASDNPSSPTSSSSSLFSPAPSLSSVSTVYQPVPAWIASEISRNVPVPLPVAKSSAVVVGAAGHSERGGVCFGGGGGDVGRDGGGPDIKSGDSSTDSAPTNNVARTDVDSDGKPPVLADFALVHRPPLHRAAHWHDRRPASRSSIIKPSDFDPPHNSGSDSDGPLTPDTMLGSLRDEHEHGVVKKQFLPKGSVATGAAADRAPVSQAESASAVASTPPRSPLFPLQDVDLVDLLNQDDRPTFVVDVSDTANHRKGPLHVVFVNTALQAIPSILDQIVSASRNPETNVVTQDDGFTRFKAWALSLDEPSTKASGPSPDAAPKRNSPLLSSPATSSFAGLQWAASTLRRRFRVIRNTSTDNSTALASRSETNTTPPPETPSPAAVAQEDASPAKGDTYFGSSPPPPVTSPEGVVHDPIDTTPTLSLEKDETQPSFDWTRIAITDDLPAHIQFARSVDWASTPLGPIEHWPGDLRTMANLVMGSPHPAAMYWGPQYTTIYNEAYTSLAGQKHPRLMGSKYADGWAEIWDDVEPIFHSAWNAGQAVLKQDNRLFIQRHGFLEETFFSWSLVPLVGSDGSVVALYNPAFENTRRAVNERRMLTLNEVGEKTATAQNIHEFWQAARQGLEYNEYDVPFVLLYSVISSNSGNDDAESDVSSILSGCITSPPHVVLEGSLGVPQDHPAAVATLDLRTSDEGFAPYMRQAMMASIGGPSSSSPSPVVLSAETGSLPTDLLCGLQGERGYDDPCRTVVVFPVQHPSVSSSGTDTAASMSISGFIVMGTNPRRPYNRDYRLFVHLLARQLTTSLASVVLYEEEVRRSQRAAHRAAQDRQELSQQLRIRTQQAVDSENKFMRMAEFTPVGMFVTDGTGRLTYCNDMWWEISRHPRGGRGAIVSTTPTSSLTPVPVPAPTNADSVSSWASWVDSVQEEDRPGLAVVWSRLVQDKVIVTHEFRFKQKTTIETDGDEPIETTTWVLLRAYPEKDENGDLKGIFGCITDISQQKLAEEFQIQLRQEAVEHKRQQENFIDITSHEMRNPLSAILQTVDEITSSISDFRAKAARGEPADYEDVFDNILEASSTISLCTNHQKRIVDDVLTLSKLDSQLLPVTPVDVQPVMVVRGTLKMFEAELVAHDIQCTFRVQPSYLDLVGVGSWVKLDPSRLNQVLINLLTNAIKFTQSCEERSIVVSIGASEGGSEPTENDVASSIAELSYVPSRQDKPEPADGSDWGDGQKINLHIAVSDTGQGLREDEKNLLFQHFSQTSPRTHVQYGGSGLGLYISRNLAELQGGQIGVASKKGHGSTFAFYIKCRKVASTPTGVQPGSSNLFSFVSEPSSPRHSSSVIAYSSGGCRDGSGSCSCKTKTVTTPTLIPQLPSSPVLIATPLLGTSTEAASWPGLPSEAITSASAGSATTVARFSASSASSSSNAAWGDMPPLDVLIVEDNLVNQRVLQRQLDKCGNRTMVANHGGEALDILRQSSFWRATDEGADARGGNPGMGVDAAIETPGGDGSATAASPSEADSRPGRNISVVLMDLEMPVMDGTTCARAIRALERSGTLLRHVPIIAVTAYARPEQIEGAKAAGIDDVISKPFRLAQLMPKIQEVVAKYKTT